MPIVDADAHVIESDRTWEYMEGSERKFKPVTAARSGRDYWVIDGRRVPRAGNIGEDTPQASREMKDIETRLRHMDQLGIDIQVLYPSLFLIPLTARPEVERALARSYNRWLADICKKGESRLRWAAVVPTLNMDDSIAAAKFAKDNGACALYLRAGPHNTGRTNRRRLVSAAYAAIRALAPRFGDRLLVTDHTLLSDPYFYPLYEEAGRLNLPI
ncbi:MAG: amidohydrolase family protein, partial [Candidatus Binatia bacterium]